MIVLDASSVIELVAGSRLGRRVGRRIEGPDETLHAPHLLDLEVAQGLRRYVAAREMTAERARVALEHLLLLDVSRYPHDALLPRIWALRENLSAYDAAYVVLAEALECPLVTCDHRLATAPGHRVRVEVVD